VELRDYWAVIQRRWLLVLGLGLSTLVASTVLALFGPTAYRAQYTLAVSVVPEPRLGPYFTYNNYYEWLTSEYLADDLSKLIESEAFAEQVGAVLGTPVEPRSVSEVTRVKKTHRMLEVTVSETSASRALDIARAHEQVLNTRMGEFLGQLKAENGYVRMINPPRVQRALTATGLALEVGLRTAVGLLAGIGLAFLLHYLDRTVHERREVEEIIGAPVLGEIPLGPRLA
jgi:capsular polysaccharide biosynthesis protein